MPKSNTKYRPSAICGKVARNYQPARPRLDKRRSTDVRRFLKLLDNVSNLFNLIGYQDEANAIDRVGQDLRRRILIDPIRDEGAPKVLH